MSSGPARPLPDRAYRLFEEKGCENAARVRRIVQVVSAIHGAPRDWRGLRVLDLGCGEGLFAIEAACHGAEVLAIDGRDARMARGRELAKELGLPALEFRNADVRTFEFEGQRPFDVVLMLGLLYHLDAPDLFRVARRAADATLRTMLVETHVAPHAEESVEHEGRSYRGWRYREHRDGDDTSVRDARLLASIGSATSFWLAPSALHALLRDVGFPTVLQCLVPAHPYEAGDRVTLAALKGGRPDLVSYPWLDTSGEEEARQRMRAPARAAPMPPFGTARERSLADTVITLGSWARARPEVVFGFGTDGVQDAGLWRRSDLEGYAGALRRVPALLAVIVGAGGEPESRLRSRARDLLDAGVPTAWVSLPDLARVLVVTGEGERSIGARDRIPEPLGLPGLAPVAAEILGRAAGS